MRSVPSDQQKRKCCLHLEIQLMGSLFDAHMHVWIQSFPASSIVQSTSTTWAHRETKYRCLLASSLSSSCVLLILSFLLSSTCSSRLLHWLIFACSSCLLHHESMGKFVWLCFSWSLRMRLCLFCTLSFPGLPQCLMDFIPSGVFCFWSP